MRFTGTTVLRIENGKIAEEMKILSTGETFTNFKSAPSAEVTIAIYDQKGQLVRQLSSTPAAVRPEEPPPVPNYWLYHATPLPKKKAQNRRGGFAAGAACAMASSHGRANARPAPRRRVRRSSSQEGWGMAGNLCHFD